MTLTLALDCDGVLFDFNEGFRHVVNEMSAVKIPEGWVPTAWDIRRDPAVQATGVDISSIYESLALPSAIKPYPYAAQLLADLHDTGASIVFATTPMKSNPVWCYLRQRACAALCRDACTPDLPVAFLADKRLVRADVLVDDKPEHVVEFEETCRLALLFDQPYNRSAAVNYRVNQTDLVTTVSRAVSIWGRRG